MSVIPDSKAARIVLIIWSSWVLMVKMGFCQFWDSLKLFSSDFLKM